METMLNHKNQKNTSCKFALFEGLKDPFKLHAHKTSMKAITLPFKHNLSLFMANFKILWRY